MEVTKKSYQAAVEARNATGEGMLANRTTKLYNSTFLTKI
jgi:hypothetical protein